MKIAVYHNLPSGGAKRALHELLKVLPGEHTVDVYTPSTSDETFGSLEPIVHAHTTVEFHPLPLLRSPFGRFNQLFRLIDLLRLRMIGRRLARRIDALSYDVAFVHPCQFEACPSILRYLRTPSVYFCQEPLRRVYEPMPARPYDGTSLLRRRWLEKIDPLPALYTRTLRMGDWKAIHAADCVLVNSKFIRAQVEDIYKIQAVVLYLGVDPDLFSPGEEASDSSLVSVGSLTPLKGFDFIIRSIAEIPLEKRPDLHIICNFEIPNERSYLTNLADSLDVKLKILRGVEDHQLAEWYGKANVTVYAPIREPFGLVALESMACGTPVVAVADGGVKETVRHDETGLLVGRDEKSFASAVETLLEQESLRQRMGEAGRREVLQNWTWRGSAERLVSVLSTCAQVDGDEDVDSPVLYQEDELEAPDVSHGVKST